MRRVVKWYVQLTPALYALWWLAVLKPKTVRFVPFAR
jgi:hypothetical protein